MVCNGTPIIIIQFSDPIPYIICSGNNYTSSCGITVLGGL
jgi:hypothetical protein